MTGSDNSGLCEVTTVDLNQELGANNILDILELPSGILGNLASISSSGALSSLAPFAATGSILSLLLSVTPNITPNSGDYAKLNGCSNWTIKYTQIYDSDESKWVTNAGVEYVTMMKYTDYYSIDSSTNVFRRTSFEEGPIIVYSKLYNDANSMKIWAVRAHEYGSGENRYFG